MTATNNPQTAADQARADLSPDDRSARPPRSRRRRSGGRARPCREERGTDPQAYDRSLDAFDTSLTTFETDLRRCRPRRCRVQSQDHRHRPPQCRCGLRPGHEPGGRQEPRRHRGTSGGLLAQAVRRIDGASRGSSRAVDEGHRRCGRADQVANGARREPSGEGALNRSRWFWR